MFVKPGHTFRHTGIVADAIAASQDSHGISTITPATEEDRQEILKVLDAYASHKIVGKDETERDCVMYVFIAHTPQYSWEIYVY